VEKPFNVTFFAVTATIIPVLFLAIAVQSDFVAKVMISSRQLRRLAQRDMRERAKRKSRLGRMSAGAHFSVAETIVGRSPA